MGIFSDIFSMAANARQSRQAKQAAEDLEWKRHGAYPGEGQWDPTYEADVAPKFQRETSPVARSFLESFLTGRNPAAVQSTRLGAQDDRNRRAAQFNNTYGGYDALTDQQRAIEQDSDRYASKTPKKVIT